MSYHYRLTPYDLSGNFNNLVDKYERFIVAREDKDKYGEPVEPHYHIYLETHYDMDTIREHFRKEWQIPKVGRGQGNKYCMLKKWEGIDYICKWADILVVKGFTDVEIDDAILKGQKYKLKRKLDNTILEAYAHGKDAGRAEGKTVYKPRESKDDKIISDLMAWYFEWKRTARENATEFDDQPRPSVKLVIENACRITRQYHKGINIFKVRDYVHTVMYEGEDYRDNLINKIHNIL